MVDLELVGKSSNLSDIESVRWDLIELPLLTK